ncbi:transport and Golgi organization protein 1 homolog isoform X3 [Ursus americanus]|uniref:transport and Golgi organization protein 1 homolog isoform X3 n=1 Tax=Ursus americanus TaxID=9643 RepID=UPI001E67ACC3|nr:transport and Golgi organization protein 1 homolog isoform X3 [Ursus americanus]
MKMQRLLFWLLLLQCPSYPNPNLVHVVPDRFILGLDGAGVLWNFAILTGYLGICAFLIYIWRTVLAIAPRQYEVTLQQIAEKIHRLKNENRELAKEISIWEEKIRERKKHRAEMKREHQFLSDKILKLKENIGKVERVNANLSVALHFKRTMLQAMREKNVKNEDMAQDALEDEEQGALESKKRVLKESKKVLEQKCNALSSLKAAKEVELKLLRKKLGIVMDFSERRKVAAEEKLEKTLYELEATKNQLSDAEENLKVTKEEIDKYKQQIGKMQDQLQEAELTFERKIAVHEKNAVGNWIKARVWERKIQQQRRENAYMIHRLRMMKGQMLPEGCMRQEAMLGRPEMWSPPRRGHWSDAEVGGAPMRNNGTEPNRDPGMYKVGPDVRGFPRPTCMPSHMDQTLPGFIGCGPPQPPPPWSTCGPPPPLVPPPCGPRSHSEACGAQGDNSGTAPKEVPEKDKVLYSSPFCTRAPGSCKALLLSRLWKQTSSSSLGVMAGPRCQDAGLFLGRNPEPNSEEREPLSVGT